MRRARTVVVVRKARRSPAERAALRAARALTPVALATLGFAGGLAVGAAAWSRLLDINRQGLFSHHPVRRFAAISYLGARPSVDTVRLLKDYIAWEPHPLLRRRARRVLRGVEAALERHGP
ncbi:MAG: hypothetical protein JO180_00345 [Gemmatirosa sp.]|nr:hypothetical protein [Gemmatirosa sp.]